MAKFNNRRLLLILILIPILLFAELLIGIGVFSGIKKINAEQAHSTQLEAYIRTTTKFASLAESAQRGYLLTGDSRYRDSFNIYRGQAEKSGTYYDTVPAQEQNPAIIAMLSVSKRKFSEMAQTIAYHDNGRHGEAVALVSSGVGKLMMDSIRQTSSTVRAEIAAQVSEDQKYEEHLFIYFFLLIALLILLSLSIVYYTYRKFAGYTRRLERLVTSLEDANNRMAEYTSMSYHELRTPLRNIHGFAQLLKVKQSALSESDEQDEFIAHILEGVRQLNATIDDMREKYLHRTDRRA